MKKKAFFLLRMKVRRTLTAIGDFALFRDPWRVVRSHRCDSELIKM